MRFSLRWLFVAVTAFACLAWFFAYRYEKVNRERLEERIINASEILLVGAHHFTGAPPGMLLTKVGGLQLTQRPEYLFPAKGFSNGKSADEYERSLLSDLKRNKSHSEVYVRNSGGSTVTYYRVLQGQRSCYACHKSSDANPDAPLAVVKLLAKRLPD